MSQRPDSPPRPSDRAPSPYRASRGHRGATTSPPLSPVADPRTTRVVITEPPRLVAAILLDRPWHRDFFNARSAVCRGGPTMLFCFRRHFVAQMRILADDGEARSVPWAWLADIPWPLLFLMDFLTGGALPTPFPGLCSLVIGLRARVLTRLRYRLQGVGMHDAAAVACCPVLAAWQQYQQVEIEEDVYPVVCCSMS